MAQALHALIYPSAPNLIVERRMIDLAEVPEHKRAWWRPVVTTGDDPFDSATQKRTGPVTTIEPTQVVDAYTVQALNAAEIDAIKEAKMPALDSAQFRILFNHENRIRVLETRPQITADQFRTAIKALL